MRFRRPAVLCLALALGATPGAPTGAAQRTGAPGPEVARLAAVARLWTTVRYAHPYLPVKEIDWDAALVEALPRIRAASTPAAYAEALTGMLAPLKDPATRVQERTPPPPATPATAPPGSSPPHPHLETREGVVVLHMTHYRELDDFTRVMAGVQQQIPALRRAAAVVVDLRERVPGSAAFVLQNFFNTAGPALTTKSIAPPAIRTVMHSGYAPQGGTSSGGYYSALQVTMPALITPAPDVAPKRVAFVVNAGSTIPSVALALQQSGEGVIVAEGEINDTAVAPSISVSMGEGITATVRTGEVVDGGGRGLRADVTVPHRAPTSAGADPAMAAALSFVAGGARPVPGSGPPAAAPASPVWRPDAAYAEMAYPPVEYRLLGVYRFWGIVDYFFPYKHLMSRNWNDALPEFIPKAIAAKDALEYNLVIAEMATWLEDSHVGVDSAAMRRFYGEGVPPVVFRYVENVPIVTGILDESLARGAGVEIGDVLVQVDGQAVEARSTELLRFLTVSNAWAARVKLARYIAAGPDSTDARLTVRGRDGQTREVTLPRRTSFLFARPAIGDAPSYRFLEPAIGYVDLTRLTPQEVDRMVDTFQQTKAIIFDMRGYPRAVFAPLGARMNRLGAPYAATFLRPVLSAGSAGMSFTFQQRIPPTARPPYLGKTVMLIDERAISQSEHTGLFLEAASGITFIGSATAGANGDVTRFVLPGGVTVGFTGHDVRHADGRQLQKVGLAPDVDVSPTIKGMREGKDEVLERALRFVREGA